MSRYAKITLVLFVLTTFCWIGCVAVQPANLEAILALAAAFFSIVFLCFLAVSISQKVSKNSSPYRVFAVADGLIGLCVAGYAIYDILTDTGWFAGVTGVILLVTVLPITLVLLLADLLVWRLRKSKD